MTSLMIGTPMYGGQCYGAYMESVLTFFGEARDKALPVELVSVNNESLITRARNFITERFMQSNHTHLMFIDADIQFQGRDIFRMLQANLDITCGLYPVKSLGQKFYAAKTIDNADKVEFKGDTPTEIAAAGTGFMLIKREVMTKMEPTLPEYLRDKKYPTKEFFTTSIDETKELLSEDYHFCIAARKLGFKVWAMPYVHLVHYGTAGF